MKNEKKSVVLVKPYQGPFKKKEAVQLASELMKCKVDGVRVFKQAKVVVRAKGEYDIYVY